jgi:oxygen-dependent protoporphyrinogen oxidase
LKRVEVAIVGGGIAGLACATELARSGIDVLVLEEASRVGGPAETRRIQGFMLERGPNTVRGTPELEELIQQVGLDVQQARRGPPYIVSNGRLLRLPPPLRQVLKGEPLPFRGWLQLLGEPFRRSHPGPRTVQDFVRQRLGRLVAERLADVMTLGVFGAPADRVGFESAFPELAERLEHHRSLVSAAIAGLTRRRGQTPRSGLISTNEGLGAIPLGLAKALGERVRVDTPVQRVAQGSEGFELTVGMRGEARITSRHVVLAVAPQIAGRLLEEPRITRILRAYRSTPQTLASFALDDAECAARWKGFGFLAPTRERLPLIGCLFPSAMFEGRAPEGNMLLPVFVGPALVDATDATIAAEIAPILQRLLGAATLPTLLDAARYPLGITLCDRRHRDRTRVLRRHLTRTGGPLVAGAAYDGVAFGKAAASGITAAREIATRL